MPRTDATNMEKITFSVPTEPLEDLKKMAEFEGLKEAELHRIVWLLGLAEYAKVISDRLTSENLRRDAEQNRKQGE